MRNNNAKQFIEVWATKSRTVVKATSWLEIQYLDYQLNQTKSCDLDTLAVFFIIPKNKNNA